MIIALHWLDITEKGWKYSAKAISINNFSWERVDSGAQGLIWEMQAPSNRLLKWSHSWAFGRTKMSKIGQSEINWCSSVNQKWEIFVRRKSIDESSFGCSLLALYINSDNSDVRSTKLAKRKECEHASSPFFCLTNKATWSKSLTIWRSFSNAFFFLFLKLYNFFFCSCFNDSV